MGDFAEIFYTHSSYIQAKAKRNTDLRDTEMIGPAPGDFGVESDDSDYEEGPPIARRSGSISIHEDTDGFSV